MEQYIVCLLIETCKSGTLKEEMLRDWIEVGESVTKRCRKLQMDVSLSLEKAKTHVRQKEAVK